MTKVKPFIKCIDYWPVKIPPEKLKAYNEMIEEGQIRKHHVTYNRVTGSTVVEYFAIAPHEWILEELKKRSERYTSNKTKMLPKEYWTVLNYISETDEKYMGDL